jgi:DNA ligase-1
VSCQSHETRYLTRSLIGKLRIGLAEQSMLVALAHACIRHDYSNLKETALKERLDLGTLAVKEAFCQCPSYDILVDVLVNKGGINQLKELCKATPGIPMKPMLAHPSKGIDEILKRCGQSEFACEYKYDGERAQVRKRLNIYV